MKPVLRWINHPDCGYWYCRQTQSGCYYWLGQWHSFSGWSPASAGLEPPDPSAPRVDVLVGMRAHRYPESLLLAARESSARIRH